jgi:hypothetical protein
MLDRGHLYRDLQELRLKLALARQRAMQARREAQAAEEQARQMVAKARELVTASRSQPAERASAGHARPRRRYG